MPFGELEIHRRGGARHGRRRRSAAMLLLLQEGGAECVLVEQHEAGTGSRYGVIDKAGFNGGLPLSPS
jgi:hypothetical protein